MRVFSTEKSEAESFLDIRNRVRSGGEKGLLGMAFHPDYTRNGWVYLSYAVTGRFVYRGTAFPSLDGTYFFGDFSSGRIWATRQSQGKWQTNVVLDSKKNISSFAQDNAGELYLLDYASGQIFHLTGK